MSMDDSKIGKRTKDDLDLMDGMFDQFNMKMNTEDAPKEQSQRIIKPSISSDLFGLSMYPDTSFCDIKEIKGRGFRLSVGRMGDVT